MKMNYIVMTKLLIPFSNKIKQEKTVIVWWQLLISLATKSNVKVHV